MEPVARHLDILLADVNPLFPAVPPLGLEVLCAALEHHGFDAEVFSASPMLQDYTQKLDQLRTFHPRAIGLQIRNYDLALLREDYPTVASFYRGVAARLRSHFDNVPLILGGIGFATDPQFWLSQLKAGYGIAGSAEAPIVQLMQLLLRGEGSLSTIPNLILPGVGAASVARYVPGRLARIERKHLDHSRWKHYAAATSRALPWANIEISRGCRYRCDFCVEPRVHGQKVIYKEPRDIIAEIQEFVDNGVFDFFFCNSEFNLDLDYCLKLCRALVDSRLAEQIRWCSYLIPTSLPLELAEAMAAAGCDSISFNAVHVNDDILASFSCPHRRASYEKCLNSAEHAGLQVSNTFLAGSALETSGTMRELMDFIDRRALRASLSLGIAHYPNLPKSRALDIDEGVKLFHNAGNGTIPYSLRLADTDILAVISWAAEQSNVVIQNAPLDMLAEQLTGADGTRAIAGATVVKTNGNGSTPDATCGEHDYLELIRQASTEDNAAAEEATAVLRRLIPLLDLPEVQLGHETPVPAPIEPAFRLYGPYRKLSVFYQSLMEFLRISQKTPDAIARLMLRLTRCTGEFPRLVDSAKPFLDAEAIAWLLELWQQQQSFHQLVFASSYACQSKCPYCYAKDVENEHPGEITMADFLLALSWAERQNCEVISFVGGEPTLHPLMKDFLRCVHDRGMKTYFNSNLLCEPEVIALFDKSWVINIGIHAQAYRYTRRELRGHFERNIAFLKEREVYLFLRYNFEHRTQEAIDDALGLARRFDVSQINFAIPMPSLSRRNRHAVEEELLSSGEFLVRVVEAFRAEGVRPILTKPIPPCAAPEDRLEFLRAGESLSPACNLPKRNWTQNVLVGPDLTISPCVGVSSRGPSLLSFKDFGEISNYMISHLREIVRPTPFAQCHTCNFYVDHRCLGGCLAYFTDGHKPVELTIQRLERSPA